jgi:hypothetical protein
LKTRIKSFIIVFSVVTLCTCIDPYVPKLNGYESLLIVEGLITNENVPYEIKLSRTSQSAIEISQKVSDAVVSVTDETGKQTKFISLGDGIYRSDNKVFTGAIGKTYVLDIVTRDGKEYKSEPSVMTPVPDIDSLYYEKETGFTNNQQETHIGINIYLDSKAGDENNRYYRWEFDEVWKFRVPDPQKFNYINEKKILPVTSVKEFCWKQQKSSEILISSVSPGQANTIKKEPLCFITPDKTDRLTVQYSILVKQYSISKMEYGFWNNLKKVNENSGDIFGSQPFPVIGNIHNINDTEERVLGFFQVSALKQKRKYITFIELKDLQLPFYHYDCRRYETSPSDYCRGVGFCIPPTWDELYKMWTAKNFTFIEPLYKPESQELSKIVFTPGICGNCELTGTVVKPDFWVDLN